MSLLEKDFETVIFDSLRGSPLYVGFDDRDGSYTKGAYSKELHCDLKLLASYIEKTQPIAWKKLQKQYPGHEAAAVAAEINKLRPKRGLLELLFGAGIMIMTRAALKPDGPVAVADLHFRRNIWLIIFGAFQACVLMWPGDILLPYGVVAIFAFPARTLAPRWKALLGVVFILRAIAPASPFESPTTSRGSAERPRDRARARAIGELS